MDTKRHATTKRWGGGGVRKSKQLKNTLRQMTMKTQLYKNLWDAAKVVLRGKFIAIQVFLKKTRKSSNKQTNLPPKIIRKRTNKT